MMNITELLTLVSILVGGSVIATAVPWDAIQVGPVRPVRAVVWGDAGVPRVVCSSLSYDRDFNHFRFRFRVRGFEGATVDYRVAEFT